MVPPAADAVAPALDAALRGIRGMMAEQREPAADAGALTLDAALRGMMAEQQRELRSIVTEQRAALAEHRAIVTDPTVSTIFITSPTQSEAAQVVEWADQPT